MMLYAIVDIETTGGYASASGITEIAIVVTDGEQIIEQYETLINPQQPIPYFITRLTGITQAMVASAPTFEEVAPTIFALLNNKIFVAHNVNFDYSFVNHQLKQHGFQLHNNKLCTVRYGKKVITGLKSYSLGNFCKALDITIENRHRAGGDCIATYFLLKKIMAADQQNELSKLIKNKNKEKNLPLQVDKEHYHNLPDGIGVYYFLDAKEKIIYIGKALNIKKRVRSHFSGNVTTKQRQEFIRNIAFIKYKLVATELMSLILESSEIKKYWPKYNKSQKHFEHQFALYHYQDQNGFIRLGVDKKKKNLPHIITVKNKIEGLIHLRKMVTEFSLCPKFCQVEYMNENVEQCLCDNICNGKTNFKKYNKKVLSAIKTIQENINSFLIIENGMIEEEKSIVAFYKGDFVGMGYAPSAINFSKYEIVEEYLEKYKPNNFINSIVTTYAEQQQHLVKLLA